jgi:2,4-dienoyl-CoA reductase-like NADH-dependent reductase (Old Yellow Enzyme family)
MLFKTFEKNNLFGVEMRNRIIRSATYEGMADDEGRPLPELGELYRALARGGVGMIITGFAGIEKQGKALKNMCMIHNDDFLDNYRKITDSMRVLKTPIVMQIAHGGGLCNPKITGCDPLAPSPYVYARHGLKSMELEEDHIIDTGHWSNKERGL